MSIDTILNETLKPVSDAISSVIFVSIPIIEGHSMPLILLWLVAISLFSTLYLGFINLRCFGHGFHLIGRALKEKAHTPGGQINRFQALSTSLSGTVGLGNIAGVAVAVSLGGAGAVFWMILMGLFGMSTKFIEATLGVKYKQVNPDGSIAGGPMYYLKQGFADKGWVRLGVFMAGLYAVCIIGGAIGAGNMFQANQTVQQIVTVTGGAEVSAWADRGWLIGLGIAFLVGLVIIGGLKSIARVASIIVPVMGLVYIGAGLVVVMAEYDRVPDVLMRIVTSAFSTEAGIGGVIGAIIQGVRRAAFSNEAGLGSAAIVHAAAHAEPPVSQGFVAMLGPFFDTVVICTLTALVILLTGSLDGQNGIGGVELTSAAFQTVIPWFPVLLAVIVFMFAFSTLITYSFYGQMGWVYLFGKGRMRELAFKLLFLCGIVLGASAQLDVVIEFSDAMYFAMAVPNVIALYMLAPLVKRDLKEYMQSIEK